MERPGLKALLADIAAGKIDVVVIYKIDRLTRSLADFARIIEVMEKHGASFVSVTQSFNTKTSMGRLMLHVLLSFAQFEREVGAERVRDKIAASKAKGMWMGGTVPLGYDAVDRKLVLDEVEAATVRALFASFVERGSVQQTLRWSQEQGLMTKVRSWAGKRIGGTPFHYGALRCVLSNRTYVGEVEYKGKVYPGQHAAIVDRELFDCAQAILASRSTDEMRRPKLAIASLLQGLIFDRHGRKMGPAHTKRNGQRFRYYVTHAKTIEAGGPAAYRIGVDAIERHRLTILAGHVAGQVRSIDESEANLNSHQKADGSRQLISDHVSRVVLGDAELTIELKDGTVLQRSLERVRHGNDAKLIVGSTLPHDELVADQQLVLLLKDAVRARELALAKPKLSLDALAAKFGRSPERFKRLIRLSYLSPKIVSAMLRGQQPTHLTSRALQHLDGLPLAWSEQETLLLS